MTDIAGLPELTAAERDMAQTPVPGLVPLRGCDPCGPGTRRWGCRQWPRRGATRSERGVQPFPAQDLSPLRPLRGLLLGQDRRLVLGREHPPLRPVTSRSHDPIVGEIRRRHRHRHPPITPRAKGRTSPDLSHPILTHRAAVAGRDQLRCSPATPARTRRAPTQVASATDSVRRRKAALTGRTTMGKPAEMTTAMATGMYWVAVMRHVWAPMARTPERI